MWPHWRQQNRSNESQPGEMNLLTKCVIQMFIYWMEELLYWILIIDEEGIWIDGSLQVRLLIVWQSRIPFKVHTSSTPREGLPGSQPASENKGFVSSPPPPTPHDSWVLLLCLQLQQPLWCRWEIQGERGL